MPDDEQMTGMIFKIARGATLEEAAKVLLDAGVNVVERLGELDMIIGTGPRDQLPALRDLPIFERVDEDTPVRIAPPDSPVQ